MCTGDVRRLEFRDEGGALSSRNSGLYAVTAHSIICLLPFLDFKATSEVINAIEAKFPGLAEGWHSVQPLKEKSEVGSAK